MSDNQPKASGENELRDCPFCGGGPEMQINGPTSEQAELMFAHGEDWDVSYFVACQCTSTGPECAEEIEAIAAWNRRSAGLGTASVKPLEWDGQWAENRSISGRTKRRIMERALTPFMAYFIEQSQDDDSWWVVEWLLGNEIAGPFEHCWQARAACDADFETRVKSCLTAIGVEAGK